MKKSIIILIMVFLLGTVMSSMAENNKKMVTKLPKCLMWHNFVPGKTTMEEVKAVLGKPHYVDKHKGGYISLVYDTENPRFPNELTFKNDKLVLAAKVTTKNRMKLSQLIKLIGKYEQKTYSYYAFHYRVCIWAKLGYLAVIDLYDNKKEVHEEQYFKPTTIEKFMKENREKFPIKNPYFE